MAVLGGDKETGGSVRSESTGGSLTVKNSGKSEQAAHDGQKEAAVCGELVSFLRGKAITLEEVGDGVFSAGVLGRGMAVEPEDETVYAPADGEIAALMEDSKHACGLKLANGMELLIHVGIDTVDMAGDGFEYLVTLGQKVKAGDPLLRFDRTKIKAAGHRDVTVCVIPNEGNAKSIQFFTGMTVKEKETIIMTIE